MLPSGVAKAGGSPPVVAPASSPGDITAGPGLPLLRISLLHRLDFNIEIVVRTDPANRG